MVGHKIMFNVGCHRPNQKLPSHVGVNTLHVSFVQWRLGLGGWLTAAGLESPGIRYSSKMKKRYYTMIKIRRPRRVFIRMPTSYQNLTQDRSLMWDFGSRSKIVHDASTAFPLIENVEYWPQLPPEGEVGIYSRAYVATECNTRSKFNVSVQIHPILSYKNMRKYFNVHYTIF